MKIKTVNVSNHGFKFYGLQTFNWLRLPATAGKLLSLTSLQTDYCDCLLLYTANPSL
jgi:hypothetical protein